MKTRTKSSASTKKTSTTRAKSPAKAGGKNSGINPGKTVRTGGKESGQQAGAKNLATATPTATPTATKSTPKGSTEIAGVRLTHPEKVLYPSAALTKRDLALYYERIAGWILPLLRDRPLTLVRCPEGEGKECFYQKHVTDQFPAAILRVPLPEGGATVTYGAIDSLQGLIALVQMGVLEIHIWGCHRDLVEKPDYAVFDLDPDEGLAWERVVEAARLMRVLLDELGLQSFLKTTGGKGLHVVLPLARRHGWEELKAFTKTVAEMVAAAQPDRYTSQMPKVKRKGRVFIDYLRNQRGATSIGAFSTRSRPGAPVSTPIAWDELDSDVRGNTFTVQTLPDRLDRLGADPWDGFDKVRQSITAEIKKTLGLG